MSYKRARRSLRGFGGVGDCGAGQVFYPNLTYAGITGQCATPAQAQAMLANGVATGNLSTAAAGGDDSSIGANIGAALKSLFGGGQPVMQPGMQMPVMLPSTGPDMTTLLLIAGVGGLGIYLLTRK